MGTKLEMRDIIPREGNTSKFTSLSSLKNNIYEKKKKKKITIHFSWSSVRELFNGKQFSSRK